jgi:hypothetical protein
VFLFWNDLLNYKAYYSLSWFKPLLRGNNLVSSDLILMMNNGYNEVSEVLEKFGKWRGNILKGRQLLYIEKQLDNYELIIFIS